MKRARLMKTRLTVARGVLAVALALAAGLSLFPPSTVTLASAGQNALLAAEPSEKLTTDSGELTFAAAEKQPTPVAEPKATYVRTASTTRTSTSSGAPVSELAEAQRILAGLIAKYPILKGSTVSFGDAKGYQAICYYKSGRIVISRSHTASLSRILNHEVWHIIDWRDNGSIDWGEQVPPK